MTNPLDWVTRGKRFSSVWVIASCYCYVTALYMLLRLNDRLLDTWKKTLLLQHDTQNAIMAYSNVLESPFTTISTLTSASLQDIA